MHKPHIGETETRLIQTRRYGPLHRPSSSTYACDNIAFYCLGELTLSLFLHPDPDHAPQAARALPGTQHVFLAFFWLAMANSAVNPIIYFYMDAKSVVPRGSIQN